MEAKQRFREGWIMLNRPFKFGELSKPLQKMTILYAYSEKPIIAMELSRKGRELIKEYDQNYNRKFIVAGISKGVRRYGETQDRYEERVSREREAIIERYSTVEFYKGQLVQAYVEKTMCRFYPDEYNIIQRDTFEHILTSDDYSMEIENKTVFDIKEVRDKVFYIQSRGIPKSFAQRMASAKLKDAVIFRPGIGVLQMFCRDHEIY